MKPLNEIRAAKAKHSSRFLKRKGVTGVDVGPKIVGGEKTDEIAIRVYVAKKRKNVAAKEKIPATINGVKTDVIQRTFVLHQRAKAAVADIVPQKDTGTYDPLVGGISIGPCRNIDGFVFSGTLGAVVEHNSTGEKMLLSNYHVLAIDPSFSVGDTMAQPSLGDTGSCPGDVVGTLQQAVLDGGSPGAPGVDCAVASHTSRGIDCSIVDIGDVMGTATASDGMAVRKRGRTTGLTHGIVDSIDLDVNVPYDGVGTVTLFDQIGIEVDPSKSAQFGISGDSGSVVVNDAERVVGLYFAGTEDGIFGVANPIQAVLDALNVSICVGKPQYEKLKDTIKDFPDKLWKSEIIEKWEKLERPEKEFRKEFKEFKEKEFESPWEHFPGQPFAQARPQGTSCIDFRTFPVGPTPNPLIVGTNSFDARDHVGNPWPSPGIKTYGAHTGLDCGFSMKIRLSPPCQTVEVTLVHFSQPASIEGFNTDGSSAGTASMSGPQNVAETLTLSGSAIETIVITAPQNETLLLEICCSDKPLKEKPEKEKVEKLEKIEKIEKIEKFEKIEKPEKEGKELPKELKEKERKELLPKELKEKELKEKERKEFLPKELKEKERKEHLPKEGKEKEFKEDVKEIKEGHKELKEKDDKDIFEKLEPEHPKSLVEGPGLPGGPFDPGPFDPRPFDPSPVDRLGRLEAAVAQLSHFIGGQLRPDLTHGALNREPDLTASTSARLRKQSTDAKQMKDNKDSEKLREG